MIVEKWIVEKWIVEKGAKTCTERKRKGRHVIKIYTTNLRTD
jgi:hypothetical protein